MILKVYDDSVSHIWGIVHCLILVKTKLEEAGFVSIIRSELGE
jgi:hypothetical protein